MVIRSPSPLQAVSSVILAMACIALGNGLVHTFVPLRMALEGFSTTDAGIVLTIFTAGSVAGCLVTGPMVRRVGHIRAFAVLSATILLSILAMTISVDMVTWSIARAAQSLGTAGLFIVVQSWLNDVTENDWRGRVLAFFYLIYIIGIGGGAFLLRFIDIAGPIALTLGAALAAASIIPIGLTKLRTPPPPERIAVSFKTAWRISPVGFLGVMTVGGLTMTLQGFMPIHATDTGMHKDDVSLMISIGMLGNLFLQWPLGWLSDRIDRRLVLIAGIAIILTAAGAFLGLGTTELVWMILVFGIWTGATESLFAISNAHANDRADPSDYVMLSSTMLIGWSLGGVLLPGLTTALTGPFGSGVFIYINMSAAVLFGLFVLSRLFIRKAPSDEDQDRFVAMPATAPITGDYARPLDEPATSARSAPDPGGPTVPKKR